MAWQELITSGAKVETEFGTGTVRQVSSYSGMAQVNVDGKLFEIPANELIAVEDGKASMELGDKVRKTEKHSTTGKVIEVNERNIKVKWDANGKTALFPKRLVEKGKLLEKVPTNEEQPEEQPEEKPEPQEEEQKQARDVADDLYGLFNLKQKLEQKIDSEVDGELRDLREAVKHSRKLEIKMGDKTTVVEGLKHKQLEQLITYAALRLSPLLVGMAGTGKTHAGQQTAEALNLNFYSISVGAQTTKTDIMGYMDANGTYIRTLFREAYENGGVFLMDEIDAGNSNVLITINAALANGIAAFPDGMVTRHEDFVFIASANTFGNGANRQYVGRNQLDAATLDRFAIIEWHVDDELESSLAVGANGKAWYMAVRASRDYVSEKSIRALISPRATQKGSRLLNVGQDINEVIDATLLGSVPEDKKADVRDVAVKIFEKFASEVKTELPSEVNPPTAADLLKDTMPF